MWTLRVISVALPTLLFASSGYAAGPISPVNVGNWRGGSYTDNSTGKFTHCAVTASYRSGILFSVAVGVGYWWRFGFINNAWHLTVGQSIPVDLTFDGRGPYHVYARVSQPNFVIIDMPTTSELVRLFRNATQMTAYTSGQLFSFSLTDTSIMLPALHRVRTESRRICCGEPARISATSGRALVPDKWRF